MPDKTKIQAINEQKERDAALLALVKNPYTRSGEIERALSEGANVHARGGRAMLDACKRFNYEVIKTLADFGALSQSIARKYLGSMCDYKGFDKTDLQQFFAMIDYAISITGSDDNYLEPYINNRAAAGDMAGLQAFKSRFTLSDVYVAQHIYPRIIFEVINNRHDDILTYVTSHRDWIDKSCFDSAVAGGEQDVLAYIIDRSDFYLPSRQAAATALFAGRTGVLDMLSDIGYDFEGRDEFFLEKACRATMTTGFAPLEYLLEHGYTLNDKYRGRTVLENALIDGNTQLAAYVRIYGAEKKE